MTLIKTLIPYEIPLNCLLSIYKLPPLNSLEQIDNYSEKYEFGFNIYKMNGNKGEFSAYFPGKMINYVHKLFVTQVNLDFKIRSTLAQKDGHRIEFIGYHPIITLLNNFTVTRKSVGIIQI